MNFLDSLLLATATWYITFCLTTLPGPRGIFTIMRGWFGIMQCKYCLSFWIGAVLYAFVYVDSVDIVYVFGVVGAAHMLASWTGANYVDSTSEVDAG